MIAEQFIANGHDIKTVTRLCGLARSTFYYEPRAGVRGRKPSTHTPSLGGVLFSNEYIIDLIKDHLMQEFVDYGYGKMTSWLTDEKGFIIDDKKVYRLMRDARLLSSRGLRVTGAANALQKICCRMRKNRSSICRWTSSTSMCMGAGATRFSSRQLMCSHAGRLPTALHGACANTTSSA